MSELTVFVHDALQKGHTRSELHDVLVQAHWPEDEIDDAISRYAELPFDVPVPYRRQSGSAREAFLYLVTFTALYISAISIGALLFGLIDHFIADPVADRYNYGDDSMSGLRWNVAALLVAFPLYLFLSHLHLRSYARDPERRTSSVRRWLTYLTLFVAANVIIGTLIALIGGVLGGEMASRFVLKSITALTLAIGVLAYYLWEMGTAEKGARR